MRIKLVILAFLWALRLVGQDTVVVSNAHPVLPEAHAVETEPNWKSFHDEAYRAATRNSEYLENDPDAPKKATAEMNYKGEGLGVLKVVALIIMGALLLALLVWIVRNAPKGNPELREEELFLSEQIERGENAEKRLQWRLEKALVAGEYALAIRMLYLQSLNALHQKGWIVWKKDKTNSMYVNELRAHTEVLTFQQLTRIYERWWFGEEHASREVFEHYQGLYDQFIAGLGHSQTKRA